MDSNTELAAVEHEMPTTEQLRKFGYWSGHYLIGCNDCKETVHGVGKRAWRCEPCAIGAFQKAALTQQPAEQISDGALGVTQRDIHLAEAILSGARGFAVRIGPEHSAAKWAARHAQQARAQGQEEGQAAVLCWLRERGALKPPGSLWSAAATLADQFEATQLPACALQPHGQGGGE